MSIPEGAPFPLGSTMVGTDPSGNLINENFLGQIHEFEFPQGTSSLATNSRVTGRRVKAICCRNVSGGALLPKRLVTSYTTSEGAPILGAANTYPAALAAQAKGVIDSWLPSAGVADDDLFWVIIEGPCYVLTPMVNTQFNGAFAPGSVLCAATHTETGTGAGRVSNTVFTTDSITQNKAMTENRIGTCLATVTTGSTNTTVLINVDMAVVI